MFTRLIDSDWFDFIYPLLLVAFVASGYFLANKYYKSKNQVWQSAGVESSVIGLFALLLAFTFSTASGTMRDRNQAIHEEANSLANLHRSSLMGDDSLRQFTSQYLLKVIGQLGHYSDVSAKEMASLHKEVEQTQRDYLRSLQVYNQSHPGAGEKYLSAFNSINASYYRMIGAYHQRIPPVIMVLLVISSLLIGMLIGFMNGHSRQQHFLAPFIFVVLVVLSIQAIRDLDNPSSGSVRPVFNNFNQLGEYVESTGH